MSRPLSRPDPLRTIAVLGALIVLIAALHAAARFNLRGPSNLDVDGITNWMDDPVLVMATVARWVALVLAYYLVVIVGVAACFGERFEETSWGRLTPSAVAGVAGILLGTSAVVFPTAAHLQSSSSVPVLPDALILTEANTPLTLVEVSPAHNPQTTETPPASPGRETEMAEATSPDSVWTVRSGDSFWSIAEETLSEDLERNDLTDVEIAEYWRLLIAANESELVDPVNPDLILPGQVLVLPPIY